MDNKIVVKHSRIEINNYEKGDSKSIEYTFSVWRPTEYCRVSKGIEYYEDEKKLILPRGIDISYLEKIFKANAYIDRQCDPYVDTDPIPIKYLTKDDRQLDTLKFVLGEDKYNRNKTKSQLCINNSTGSGKTFVAVASICFTGRRSAIITNSIGWLDQWKERIKEYTPLTDADIYNISGAASINRLFSIDPLQYTIFLVSHDTIKSYGDKYGWDKITELFKHMKCGYKIYDEAHLYFDNICRIDYHTNTKRTLYLTATPERSDAEENTIYQLYFRNIPSIDLFNPELDPHTHYNAIHYNTHPSPYEISSFKGAYGFDRNSYTNYVVNTENFNKLLVLLIDKYLHMDGKCLVFIGTNRSIDEVYENLIIQFPFLVNSIGVYTSQTKINKDEQLKKKIILSTTKSAGTASDIADLVCTTNLAEPFRSPVLTKQTLGRTRADNTIFIDIVDEGVYYCKNYYKAKKPIYSVYAKSCHDIYMDDYELDDRCKKILDKYEGKKLMCNRIFKE